MLKLEDLKKGLRIQGVLANEAVTLVDVELNGDTADIFYKKTDGQPGTSLLFRENESELAVAQRPNYWSLDADATQLALVSEAYRIDLAYLFDPRLAVHTSLIEPLPHQITAVYSEMLRRQPLRFLLADDPGAGKTIMAGLLIKELIARGDVQRCLICAPGSLVDQWQSELWEKFHLRFEILTRDRVTHSISGNPFQDEDHLLVRLDQISRNNELQELLAQSDWDLVISDEAHKMAAHLFNDEIDETKRYKLGKLLGRRTRHLLLMTATPHNGKEADFQLFLALLDADRFEGSWHDGDQPTDTSDLMRRMLKEKLLRFDGRPLFPERLASTVDYQLTPQEWQLYEDVTEYVQREFDRAEQLANDGRRGTIGFALTILQRRLASSPAAIYQSLLRRRQKLEGRRDEIIQMQEQEPLSFPADLPLHTAAEWDDLDEYADIRQEERETELVERATAAHTIAELEAEIEILKKLEQQADAVRQLGIDGKWQELAELMQSPEMFTPQGLRHKLVIFTEHRDTLDYLQDKLTTLLGDPDAIVIIHGSVSHPNRQAAQEQFRNNPTVTILLATDAAGEGVNLQRAHLMINYDLPWNPNRLEQRFGRIHRIGQEEVCHLWNLVAGDTREGYVYHRLLEKLRRERDALGGQVFDVLGQLFRTTSLRELLVEAIRYGNQPEVRGRLEQAVDNATEREHIRQLLDQHSLVQQMMDTQEIQQVRAEMERAAAQRLQPHYIKKFFIDAFHQLGGKLYTQEAGRYKIHHVPALIRSHAQKARVASAYERICFDKKDIHIAEKPQAEFICPGHALLDSTIRLIRQQYNSVLQQGAVLIDRQDMGQDVRALFYIEQSIYDGRDQPISQAVHFVEINAADSAGSIHQVGYAPYLDYAPPTEEERERIIDGGYLAVLDEDTEVAVKRYATTELAQQHLTEIKDQRLPLIKKTMDAVRLRLNKEINYWDGKANEYKEQERSGKRNIKLNWKLAQQRADQLVERLKRRIEELEAERQLSARPPIIVGRALVIPWGLLLDEIPVDLSQRAITEQIAMQVVMEAEIALGHDPKDVSEQKLGYDIESRDRQTGRLRFIEVKGRQAQAETVTVTHNEILSALNSGLQYALAIVLIQDGKAESPRYLWKPPFREPDSSEASVNFRLSALLEASQPPS